MHREHLVVLLQGVLELKNGPADIPLLEAPQPVLVIPRGSRDVTRGESWRTHEQRKTEGTELGAEGVFHGRCGPAVYREAAL